MPPVCVTLARHAMATRFELVLHGSNETMLRAAGEEALDEIDRLERQLSLFRPTSEIADVNQRAHRTPVRVSPPIFSLLQHARRLSEETGGAFDISIAPLLRAWGFLGGSGHLPDRETLAAARQVVGMSLVELDPGTFTVRFARPGVMLDLGALGKGYAVERAVELLREAGVTRALLHGGTSTVSALGAPPDQQHWKIAIDPPTLPTGLPAGREPEALPPLATFLLKNQSLSVSAVWGKCFMADQTRLGHVLDPRTAQPVAGTLLSAVVLPSATETDALSTALLVCGSAGQQKIASLRPGMRTLVVSESPDGYRVHHFPPDA